MQDVFICGAKRTPMGGFQGELASISAPQLGGHAIKAVMEDATIPTDAIEQAVMGLVLSAGVGQAPARQAAFAGGLEEHTPAVAISKVCGSGLQAVITGAMAIQTGFHQAVVAGGMESMTHAPYLSAKTRSGARLGHTELKDHMFLDGLEDAYKRGALMGNFAETCAEHYGFERAAQDHYAICSLERALHAQKTGAFEGEIAPITVKGRKQDSVVASDEQPRLANIEKIPHLRPAFQQDGTVTAANASSISDGAAALLLTSSDAVSQYGLKPRARIAGFAGQAQDPAWFTTAPVGATQTLLTRLGKSVSDVDIWEVNEAFAVVPMAFMKDLGIAPDIMNINGGACALGHPIGASGARILVTLLNALEQRDLSFGVAAICIGGGEGLAIAIERV